MLLLFSIFIGLIGCIVTLNVMANRIYSRMTSQEQIASDAADDYELQTW